MKKPVYLDYAATTPVDARVIARMTECLGMDGVFGNRSDQVTTARLARLCSPLDRQVVGFGSATGPDDFSRVRIDQVSDLATRIFHRLLGEPAIHMRA